MSRDNPPQRVLLLVDDEMNILSALSRLLRRDGYQILRANSGQEGLDLLAENEVGVIISDQRMPNMTGAEFLSRVKERYPQTIRIMLSGYTDLDSVTDAINHGAIYKFLTKPWDDDLLRQNIAKAFNYYEMEAENKQLHHELSETNERLVKVNSDLERRVEEKTHEIKRNMHILQVSQEVLEHLPIAVVGIDEFGMVVIANRSANELLNKGVLVGQSIDDIVPAPFLSYIHAPSLSEQGDMVDIELEQGSSWRVSVSSLKSAVGAEGRVLTFLPQNGKSA